MPGSIPARADDDLGVLRDAMGRLGPGLGRLAEGQVPEPGSDRDLAGLVFGRLGIGCGTRPARCAPRGDVPGQAGRQNQCGVL